MKKRDPETFVIGLAAGVVVGALAVLSLFPAKAGTTSEPQRDRLIYGDHARTVYQSIMQRCGPGYSVGHYPEGRNPQDHCGGDNEQRHDTNITRDRNPPDLSKPDNTPDRPSIKGNNGWGNGSQDAPGASGPHNNAENGPKGKNDGRGKASGNSGREK